MDAKRWEQVKEIFDRALNLYGDERKSFLAEACAGDADLRREVEPLLAAYANSMTFLQASTVEVAPKVVVVDEFPSNEAVRLPATLQLIGLELANYKIISLLGKGGSIPARTQSNHQPPPTVNDLPIFPSFDRLKFPTSRRFQSNHY
jgi:eukaryotic-like serine/threonine-protein kinase